MQTKNRNTLSDYKNSFILEIDASHTGVDAILSQFGQDESKKKISYA